MHFCLAALGFVIGALASPFSFSFPKNVSPSNPGLVGLSSGLIAPSSPGLVVPSSPRPISLCLNRYTNYWDATENHVLFTDPKEPHFNFTILTTYLRFYPSTLTQWLEEKGFHVYNASSIPDSQLCGWISAGPVQVEGRVHGMIGWKYIHHYLRTSIPNTGNSSLRTVLPRHHIAAHMNTTPNDETLRRVQAILRANSPDADIYYFTSLMLSAACGTLGIAIIFYGLLLFNELRKTRRAPDDSQDIELDQIKVHNLSGSGMQRMDARDVAAVPKFTVEITASAPGGLGASSVGSSVADPPPVYCVDGVGR